MLLDFSYRFHFEPHRSKHGLLHPQLNPSFHMNYDKSIVSLPIAFGTLFSSELLLIPDVLVNRSLVHKICQIASDTV